MTMLLWLYDIFTHHPSEPFWKLCVKFAFFAIAFDGGLGAMFWRENERAFQTPAEDEVVAQNL